MEAIEANPAARDAEHHGRAPILERVEGHQDVLGLGHVVAAAQRRLDGAAVAIEHTRADVEGAVVVGEAHFHVVGRHAAFGRLLHHEVGDRLGETPGLVGQSAVDGDAAAGDPGGRGALRRASRRCAGRLPLRARGGGHDDQQADEDGETHQSRRMTIGGTRAAMIPRPVLVRCHGSAWR